METRNIKNINYFGVKTLSNGTSVLFYALEGMFASSAWRKSDEAFSQIAGESFLAYTADDGKEYNIGKRNIRRVDTQELSQLLETASPVFHLMVELSEMETRGIKEYIQASEFKSAVPYLIEQGYSLDSLKEYYKEHYC